MFNHARIARFNTVALLVALSATILSGCGSEGSATAAASAVRTISVRAAMVEHGGQVEPLRFAGVVRARQRAALTFQVGGVLQERTVELGQQVEAGQLLARLYNPELIPARDAAKGRLAELKAQTAQAQRDLERAEQLFERGVVSVQEREQRKASLDALRAGVASAEALLRQSEQMSGESALRAPFAGSIEAVEVEPGEFVAPGQPVMRLAAAGGQEVEVRVPAQLLDGLEVGASVPVWHSLSGSESAGRIAEIGLGSSVGGALYPLVVSLDETAARSGDGVEVGLVRPGRDELTVPVSSVMRSATGLSVFRVEGDEVRRVPVEIASLQGERAVLNGSQLTVGDRVVYAGITRLADGDRVELLP